MTKTKDAVDQAAAKFVSIAKGRSLTYKYGSRVWATEKGAANDHWLFIFATDEELRRARFLVASNKLQQYIRCDVKFSE